MKLYSGETYWNKTSTTSHDFKQLESDLKTDILIVGGGMSGNLLAYSLAKRGKSVTLIEKDKLGSGSSTANTGLLQYSSDIMVSELADEIGKSDAIMFYEMCLDAMNMLTEVNKSLNADTDYRNRESIYYASSEDDGVKLEREYNYLNDYDFPVKFLDENHLKDIYKINKSCALKTWADADVNPYKFIQALADANVEMGVTYFENTSIDLENIKENTVITSTDHEIEFKNIVLATGYTKIYPIIEDKSQVNRTYAFASKPLESSPWKDEVMVWETKDPYLYFRTTVDKRIIAGGLDEEIAVVVENENTIYQKTEDIKKQIKNLFPDLDFEIEYRWNAIFANSKDGLPFIGRDPEVNNKYYLLGYEGNGTCYSMAGSEIISDLLEGKDNIYSHIVKVDR